MSSKKSIKILTDILSYFAHPNIVIFISGDYQVFEQSLMAYFMSETKEVTLVVSIRITEDLLDTLDNNAEIYESYNEQGIADIDSTEANKIETEDDMSNADIVLGVVTGKIVLYSTLILSIIFIIVIGAFLIQRNVLAPKKDEGKLFGTESKKKRK